MQFRAENASINLLLLHSKERLTFLEGLNVLLEGNYDVINAYIFAFFLSFEI